eukprot:Gb_39886 [translate_table: standard]
MEGMWMVVAVAAVAVLCGQYLVREGRGFKAKGFPPGSMGLPLLGEFIQFFLRTDHFVEQRRKKYGNVFATSLLGYPTVISTDPQVSKFMLHEDGRLFAPRYPTSLTQLLGKWNIMSTSGDLHKQMRRALLAYINSSLLKHPFLSHIENVILSNLQSWGGRIVDVMQEAQEMTFSFMAHQLMSLSPGDKELERMKNDFHVLRKGIVNLPLRLPGTTYYYSFQKRQELLKQMKAIVDERKRMSPDPHEDFLSTLLKINNEDNRFQLTTDQILDLMVGLLFGGFDTTARTMALVVKRLSENPHVVQLLRVIKETLRLGYRVNNLTFRKTLENVEIRGYTIPKGWTCIVYDRSSNMDDNYYKDPLTFNPWRWQEKNVNRAPFTPFGGGPRLCPGNELAMLELSFFIHHLVTQFKWESISSNTKASLMDSIFTFAIDIIIRTENL